MTGTLYRPNALKISYKESTLINPPNFIVDYFFFSEKFSLSEEVLLHTFQCIFTKRNFYGTGLYKVPDWNLTDLNCIQFYVFVSRKIWIDPIKIA